MTGTTMPTKIATNARIAKVGQRCDMPELRSIKQMAEANAGTVQSTEMIEALRMAERIEPFSSDLRIALALRRRVIGRFEGGDLAGVGSAVCWRTGVPPLASQGWDAGRCCVLSATDDSEKKGLACCFEALASALH